MKKKSASETTDNDFPATPVVPDESTMEPSHSQSTSLESPSISHPNLINESIEPQPSVCQEKPPTLPADSSSVPHASENNDSTEEPSIQTENYISTSKFETVCVFCNKKYKKLRSKMLPLHEADTNKFKSSVLPNIEGQDEHTELLNKLKNFFGPKIHYHTECRVSFNNKITSSNISFNRG